MKVQKIENKKSFGSVIKTENNELTKQLYSLLKMNKQHKINIFRKSHFEEREGQGSILILIDDKFGKDATKYLKFEQDYQKRNSDLYQKSEEELEQMVSPQKRKQFKEEISSPLIPNYSRGNTYLSKLLEEINADLSNQRNRFVKNLYKQFLAKAKVITNNDIFNAISNIEK